MRQQTYVAWEQNSFIPEEERNQGAGMLPTALSLTEEHDPPDGAPSPEQAAARSQQICRLREAIDGLPPKARWTMQQLFLEGHTYAEVSKALAVRREHLRVIVHRATVDLRVAMTSASRAEQRPT